MQSAAKVLARQAGLGKVALYAFHRPIGLVRRSIKEGGPLEQRRTELGRRQMVEAAKRLPALSTSLPDRGYKIHFLTGARYWYQALFCAWSMQRHCPVQITPILHDDGSLRQEHADLIRRAIPWARFAWLPDIAARLDATLPAARFPELRARRLIYPHLRKLTDIHSGRQGWTLVLDADMLFFREPCFLLNWLAAPSAACHMCDALPAYGYSIPLMQRLAGAPIPPLINVGFCGLRSEMIDWAELEHWCTVLVECEGMSYFLEQALTAMLLARQPRIAALSADYRVLPDLQEGRFPTAVLHHYVAESKRSYFQHGWRRVLAEHAP